MDAQEKIICVRAKRVKITGSRCKRLRLRCGDEERLCLILRRLRRQIRHLKKEQRELERQVHRLQIQVNELQAEVESGIFPNPQLQALFESKLGESVTIGTLGGDVTGIVTLVGTDAVELTESSGDIVIAPYQNIEAVS